MYATIDSYQYFINNKEHFSEHKKIINLITYNQQLSYENEMKWIQQSYLQTIPYVQFYFITLCEQEEDLIIKDNVMYIKGTESFVPGILDKTVKAIEYCYHNLEYDYIIRTTMATVIDFSQLNENDITHHYMGCNPMTLQWLDPEFGIKDNSLFGLTFLQGINIILNNTAVENLMLHKDNIRRDIVDDVSLAIFFNKNNDKNIRLGNVSVNNSSDNAFCYRNRSHDRQDDINRMKYIVNKISKKI